MCGGEINLTEPVTCVPNYLVADTDALFKLPTMNVLSLYRTVVQFSFVLDQRKDEIILTTQYALDNGIQPTNMPKLLVSNEPTQLTYIDNTHTKVCIRSIITYQPPTTPFSLEGITVIKPILTLNISAKVDNSCCQDANGSWTYIFNLSYEIFQSNPIGLPNDTTNSCQCPGALALNKSKPLALKSKSKKLSLHDNSIINHNLMQKCSSNSLSLPTWIMGTIYDTNINVFGFKIKNVCISPPNIGLVATWNAYDNINNVTNVRITGKRNDPDIKLFNGIIELLFTTSDDEPINPQIDPPQPQLVQQAGIPFLFQIKKCSHDCKRKKHNCCCKRKTQIC